MIFKVSTKASFTFFKDTRHSLVIERTCAMKMDLQDIDVESAKTRMKNVIEHSVMTLMSEELPEGYRNRKNWKFETKVEGMLENE